LADRGAIIRQRRILKRMTQAQLCEVTGLTRQTIVDLEAGRFEPSEATYRDILTKIEQYERPEAA
jgi:transcriptional regulator with XRE-family HTH domain